MARSGDSQPPRDVGRATLSIRNLGGIEHCELSFDPGLTVLSGRNATNRTSVLSALGGVLGGTTPSLKSDAEEGRVTLGFDDQEYTREYVRTEEGVRVQGSPYTEDEDLVDLCVAVLEDNPARRAVERGDDIRQVIMRPVDTDAIEARITELQQTREELEDEIEKVENRRSRLPDLETERQELRWEMDELEQELAELREHIDGYELDPEDPEDATEVIDELERRRQELRRIEDDIDVKRAEHEGLLDEMDRLEAELDEVSDTPTETVGDLDEELREKRNRSNVLADTIASLTTIIEFNDQLLSGGIDLPGIEPSEAEVPAALAPDAEQVVVCWTCGSEVRRGDIADRLDDLRRLVEETRSTRRDVQETVAQLQERKEEHRRLVERKERLERQRDETAERAADHQTEVKALEDDADRVRSEIRELESQIAETGNLQDDDLMAMFDRLGELQYEMARAEQQLDDIEEEITKIEGLPDPSELTDRREDVQAQLERERSRIGDLENAAVEAFNEHMNLLLEILEYENLDRVWIEKKKEESARGRRVEATFDIHVIRGSGDGGGYEDDIANVSESEREVIGLVVTLAGYLVHEAAEEIPFMLLDSVEAIDAERIAALVEHFADHVPMLIVALLPEDADALDDGVERLAADAILG